MAKPSQETIVKFKADTKDYETRVKALNESTKKIKQELKLTQTEMKLSGSATDKLQASLSSLEKQYQLAKQKTKECADQLQRAKMVWGENSTEVAKLETKLRSHQITEKQLSNTIKQTADSLKQAKLAEQQRTSETAKAAQKLQDLKGKEEQLQASTAKMNAQYELQKTKLGANASETEKLRLKIDHLGNQHTIAAEKVRNYQQQFDQAKRKYGENANEVKRYETKLLEARTAEQQLKNQMDAVNTSLREQESVTRRASQALDTAGSKMKSAGRTMTAAVTLPVAGLGTAIVKTGMDFEASMSEVKAISGATGKDFQALGKKAEELGAKTSKSASESAQAMKYQALAGWDVQVILKGTEPILRLSEAGNLDLARASDMVTDSMSALGLTVDDLPRYLDVMAQTSRKSNTDIDALGEAFLRVGGTFNGLKVPVEEGAAVLGLLANRGLKAGEAGQALSSTLVNLTAPTGQAKEALDQLKFSAFDKQGNFKGLSNILYELKDKMAGMTQEEKNQIIAMVAGKEQIKTFNGLLNGMGDEYEQLKKNIDHSNGALGEMSKVMNDNLKGKFKEMKSALEGMAITLYKSLQPALTKIVEALTSLFQWIQNLSPTTQKVIVTIGAIVAVVGPLLIVLGLLVSSIGTIATAVGGVISFFASFGTATAVVGTASGVAAVGVGGLGTALGGLLVAAAPWIAAAALVGVAAYGIYKAFTQEATPAVDLFKERVNYAADGTVQSVEKISESTQKAVGSFMDMAQQANSTTVTMFAQQTQITDENLPQITAKYEEMKNQVVNAFEQKKQQAVTKTQEAFQGVQTVTAEEQAHILTMYDQHFEMEKSKTQAAKDKIVEIWNKAKEEKRALTEDENKQIQNLQDVFNEQAVRAMAENKAEQEVILNNLKNSKERMNADMLSDAVKKINQTHDKTVEKAREERDKRVKQAEMMKIELGSAAEGTANKLIEEANKQYEKVKNSANQTKREGIDKLKGSYKDLEDQVDTSTGNILTYWDKIKRWWNNWTPVKKVMEVFSTGGQEAQQSAKRNFSAPKSSAPAREESSPVPVRAFKGGQSLIPPGITEQMNTIKKARAVSAAREGGVLSPAVFSQGILSNLPQMAHSAMAIATGKQQSLRQPTQPTVEGGSVEMNFYTTVRNDRDIDRMFEKADDWLVQKGRNINIGMGRNEVAGRRN